MNFKAIKQLFFGSPKPFQMTREPIPFDETETPALEHLAELLDIEPSKAFFEISETPYLKPFVDYLKTYHEVGRGDQNADYEALLKQSERTQSRRTLPLKVGIVSDLFLYRALEGACELEYINQPQCMTQYDFVIIASTWEGVDGYWRGNTQMHSTRFQELQQLMADCQSRNIPVVFFNKEDPVNFEVFQMHAQCADVVITTEVALVEKYKALLGHQRVKAMHFPVNPEWHHPIGTHRAATKRDVVFAGSWLNKYEERTNDMMMLFDGALENGLDLTIFDRNLWHNRTKYQYPARYLPYIAAPLTHAHTLTMYRTFPIVLNLNTVKYSKSMCANRIFEQQAMGSFLVSNYNAFVNMTFPQIQIIFELADMAKVKKLDAMLMNRARAIGTQKMMLSMTHVHWLNEMAQFLGRSTPNLSNPWVSVIISDDDALASDMFQAQTYQHKKSVSRIADVDTPFYTYFSSQHQYAPEYLADLMAATVYTQSPFITKMAQGYRYVDTFEERELTLFQRDSVDETDREQQGFALDLTFVDDMPQQSVVHHQQPALSVIVPVHNNGTHLEHKCLRSMISHTLFPQLEIILVDDGSTDDYTKRLIALYCQWYANIRVIELAKASGSASTPRNVGIERAQAPLIAFLDPDNEWVGEGMTQLFNEMRAHPEIDVVVGNMIKADDNQTQVHRYYDAFVAVAQADRTEDTRTLLHNMKLKTASIQALITKKSLLQRHKIRMVPGALGQDSLFFLQLMHYARVVKVVNHNIHVYYAANTNSMTNQITAEFFNKYERLEEEKINFLTKQGYIDTYMKYRFNYYIYHWYIARLKRSTLHSEETIQAFLRIVERYASFKRPHDATLLKEIEQLKRKVKS
ncbi:glycosyltransferase [Staphylococcus lutrae]|uniref:Glycosyltransferase 2-like domain-containing protein n=1 Tax=Staphylococcus lutrae TaxID=155085 RepID=A0AAC9RV97_9STAP|nr:glycosyltransferase [Staphylococcus lutrae]ARJ51492.1 hypothetical protein B5P37_09315 [Staphylococcus lutrae]PNZ38681.1 hypothetical protein CD134_03835 [Staphylococcus lutrae]